MAATPEVAAMSEFHDEYSEALDGEFRKLEDALLSDEVRLLAPSEPVRVSPDTTVAEAVARMVDNRRAAVVIASRGAPRVRWSHWPASRGRTRRPPS